MKILRQVEELFGKILKGIPGGGNREPVEIKRDIILEIAEKVQPAGDGEYVFPFTDIAIMVYYQDSAERPLLEALLDRKTLESAILDEVARSGCKLVSLNVSVEFSDDPRTVEQGRRYLIRGSRGAPDRNRNPSIPRPPARLTVLRGAADCKEIDIQQDRINIGRQREVVSKDGRLARRNDLAFLESEHTVGRLQAHVVWDGSRGHFRIYDDTQHGTWVLREGQTKDCDSTHGVQLRSGDELVFGDARVLFQLLSPTAPY